MCPLCCLCAGLDTVILSCSIRLVRICLRGQLPAAPMPCTRMYSYNTTTPFTAGLHRQLSIPVLIIYIHTEIRAPAKHCSLCWWNVALCKWLQSHTVLRLISWITSNSLVWVESDTLVRGRPRGMGCHSAHELTSSHDQVPLDITTPSPIITLLTSVTWSSPCVVYFHKYTFIIYDVMYEVYISNIIKIKLVVAKEMRIVTSQTIRDVEAVEDLHWYGHEHRCSFQGHLHFKRRSWQRHDTASIP